MPTLFFYDSAPLYVVTNDLSAGTLKVLLLNSSAVFDSTDTTVSGVTSAGANEVSGNNWTSGGETLTSVAWTQTANGAKLSADDVSVVITGGDLGPVSTYLIADGTQPLAFVELDAPVTVLENNAAEIIWDADGVFTIEPVAPV